VTEVARAQTETLARAPRLCQKERPPPGDTKAVTAIQPAFERTGEENAFAVLARAAELRSRSAPRPCATAFLLLLMSPREPTLTRASQ
jgi:hypothetical protein